jgi:hypothetical protein
MNDSAADWTVYLEDLERQAVLLRRRPPQRPAAWRLGPALAALVARLRPPAAGRRGSVSAAERG